MPFVSYTDACTNKLPKYGETRAELQNEKEFNGILMVLFDAEHDPR